MMLSGVSRGKLAAIKGRAASSRPRNPLIRNRPVDTASRCRPCQFLAFTSKGGQADEDAAIAITTQDIQSLKAEMKALQSMLQQSRSQNDHIESLTRNLASRTSRIEGRLDEINDHVSKISALEKMVASARDLLQQNPAVQGVVNNLETIVQRSRPYFRNYKYVLLAAGIGVTVVWKYRANLFYQRTSEEVADLARRTLEQDSLRLSIQETLQTVANSPATLETLNQLIEKLIAHERTQQDLVNLIVFAVQTPEVQAALLVMLQDPKLQLVAGEFLLKGLDMTSVKEMLDAQTADLTRETVSNDSVQQATAIGLQRTVRYSVTPSFLWRFMERKKEGKQEDGENDDGSTTDRNKDPDSQNVPSTPHQEEELPSQ